MQVYSVVTGASKGIGKALAIKCANMGRNLILVSLPHEGLADLAHKLSVDFDIDTQFYETDLTEHGSVDDFYNWCEENGFQINMLINNAGIGSQGMFELSAPEHFQQMMQLNMNTVASMCWSGLSFLKKHNRSYILNVGSISSFSPIPYKAIYSATKHFVLAFSNALYYELKPGSVFVSCLCPGPTITSEEHRAKVEEQGLKAKILAKKADEVAHKAIEGLLHEKRIIIPGAANKLFFWLTQMLPINLRLKLAGAVFSDSSYNHSNK